MFAQESVMDIQNIVTEQDTETLDAEIAAMTAAFTEEHYLNNDEAEHLEMIAAKSMVLGELYERAKWQAKAQAVPEWISVNDNLPPANMLVLGMSQTRSNIFNVYNVMALDEFEEADVTHWMPLPDAPQEPTND
jgi:Ser/Thr protein kinase RdoA (MazF antagonist)